MYEIILSSHERSNESHYALSAEVSVSNISRRNLMQMFASPLAIAISRYELTNRPIDL